MQKASVFIGNLHPHPATRNLHPATRILHPATCSLHPPASKYFPDLSQKGGTLSATRLANSLMTFLKKPASIVGIEKENLKQSSSNTLSLREMAGLQYLGGYVFRNLHHKIQGSSKWKTTSCQQSLPILGAAKLEEVTKSQSWYTV